LRLILDDKTIITDEESMVENLNDFFLLVGTRHSTLGKIDEADKYCSSAVNSLKPLVFEPMTTKVLFDIKILYQINTQKVQMVCHEKF